MSLPDSMPAPSLGPVVEVREPKESAVQWHIYWNHPEGLGSACGSQVGCFTLAPENVTCAKCMEVMKGESK